MSKSKGWWALITTIVAVFLCPGLARAQDTFTSDQSQGPVVQAEVGWNRQLLPSPGLSYCHVSLRKGANSVGPEPKLAAAGHGNFLATAEEGVPIQVLVTCTTKGNTTPAGFVDGDGVHRMIGHALWYCPIGVNEDYCDAVDQNGAAHHTRLPLVSDHEKTTISWSDGNNSESIAITWSVSDSTATKTEVAAVKDTADRAFVDAGNALQNNGGHRLEQRSFSLRLGYVRSLDTQNEPARSGYVLGLEGYVLGDDGPVKMSLGAVLSRTEWQVPVLNAPNLQGPNQYVDGAKTYIGPTIGVNWIPGANFILNGRGSLGVWIWENGTTDLSQTQNGAVFISPSSTYRPISGRLEFSASYAIAGVVPVGVGLALTRNLEPAQTFRGFEFPGYTIPEGHLTDVDGIIHVGFIW